MTQSNRGILFFHNDQHGTSIVALAAFLNALKIVNKPQIDEVKVAIAGAVLPATEFQRY